MSEDEPLFIDCDKHGRGISAIVCLHLSSKQKKPIGFVENSSEPGDKQAWCHECEDFYIEEGEITGAFKAFNDFAVVCETCYANAKANHICPS